jgi:hypothetical protein
MVNRVRDRSSPRGGRSGAAGEGGNPDRSLRRRPWTCHRQALRGCGEGDSFTTLVRRRGGVMRIGIIGTSNSILAGGYTAGLASAEGVEVVRVATVGESLGLFFTVLIDETVAAICDFASLILPEMKRITSGTFDYLSKLLKTISTPVSRGCGRWTCCQYSCLCPAKALT